MPPCIGVLNCLRDVLRASQRVKVLDCQPSLVLSAGLPLIGSIALITLHLPGSSLKLN